MLLANYTDEDFERNVEGLFKSNDRATGLKINSPDLLQHFLVYTNKNVYHFQVVDLHNLFMFCMNWRFGEAWR